jgi:c-di-GMP-binding flagellar brake protein YcgR
VLYRNLPGGSEENHNKCSIVDVRAEILTRDFPNTKQEEKSLDEDFQFEKNAQRKTAQYEWEDIW